MCYSIIVITFGQVVQERLGGETMRRDHEENEGVKDREAKLS